MWPDDGSDALCSVQEDCSGPPCSGEQGAYGVGLVTTSAVSDAASGPAAPLRVVSTPTSTPISPAPVLIPKPDDSPALRADDLSYRTREFTAEAVFRSKVSVKVPRNWRMTQPDPKIDARFTDPYAKRWIRVEAGFTIRRPPEESLTERVDQLKKLNPAQSLAILSRQSGTVSGSDGVRRTCATLTYSYIPIEEGSAGSLRFVIVRWASLDKTGFAAVEMSSTGLPQDRAALESVLEHATTSVTRTDSSL